MKKCFFFILTVATVFLSLPGVVQAATCTSKICFLAPCAWDMNDSWDCTNYPTAADDVILSNAAPIIVNAADAAASIRWETLTGSRSLNIGGGRSLTVSGAVNLNGTATYSVSFLGTGTFFPATTVYYCSGNPGPVNGITCVASGPPEINLKQGAANIASADSHDFGSVAVGSNSGAITFTIENTGSANLTLSGSPKIVKSGTDAADFTVNETSTTSPVAGAASTTFTVTFTPSSAAAKTATLSIANNDSDENPYTVTLNGTGTPAAPTVSSVSASTANGSYNAGDTVSVTVTFSEAVNVSGGTPQLTLETGTTDAVVNYTSGSGTATLTFTYTVAAGHNSADLDYADTASLALNTGTIKDTATGLKDAILTLPSPGAANSLGANKAIVIDTTAPTLAEVTAVTTPTNDNTPDYTFSGTEVGTISYSGDCSSATAAAVIGNNTVTFNALGDGAHSNCKISVTDTAGNASADLAVSSFTVDTVAPTVTINQASGQADPANSTPVNFTVVFSESVTGFATGDVTLTGTAGAATGTVTGSGTTYNVAVTGMTSAGTVIADIASAKAADAAGNGNAASTSTDNQVDFTPPPPSVSSIDRTGTTPTNAASVQFTVTFSENVTGVDTGDFSVSQTGITGASVTGVSGSGDTYTVTVSTGTGDGTLGLNLTDDDSIKNTMNSPLGGAGAGNGNFTGQTYTVDKTAPTVTVNQASGQADPANSTPVNFTVVFSESVTGFATGDVTLTGTAGAATGTVTGSGTTYNVAVTGMTSAGTVIADIASAKAADAAGNGNAASTSTDNQVDFTPPPPSVSSIDRTGTTPTNAASVQFTVTFSESVSGIDTGDFTLAATGTASGAVASVSAASGTTVTVTVNTVTGDGTLGLNLNDNDSIVNGMSVPLGGAGAGNGNFTGQIYTVDRVSPAVTLSSAASEPTGSSQFGVTATFSESVTGFAIGDISVTNGSAGNFTAVSGTVYTFDVTPAADGSVTVNIAANAAQDSIGNNSAATTAATELTRTYDQTLVPGYGSSPASGSTVSVGTANVGSSVSTALAVGETGSATLNVTSHSLGGANPGDFSVAPATLSIADGGAAQNFTIQCTPLLAGARTATLTVNHNAAGSPATYTLNCTGTAAPLPPPPPAGLPAAPSGLTAQPVSHDAIYLTWTDSSNNETGFIIERWSLGAAWVAVGVAGADATSYTDSPLSYSWEYHYRIRAYNAAGNSDYGNETSAITWFHPYETCKGVTLNGSEAVYGSASVQENAPAGTVIGTFGTIEPTGGHRYEFFPEPVPGIDNRYFIIDGNVLKLSGTVKPDYEEKKELRISLLSIDSATPYAWCHAEFVIAVTDVPEGPAFLHLSNYAGSVPENEPGAFAANIVSEDDAGDTHTYSLVSGEGDTDNALFRIEGNTLKTGIGVDYETNPKPSVRIRSTDQTGAYFERFIVLTVRNTPDPPLLSDMANANTDDDVAASVKFTVSDQDTAFSYLTVSAKSDNAAVLPDANIALSGTGADRTLTLTPVKGKAGSAKITVTLTDGDFAVEKSFTLTVTTGPGLRAVIRIEGGTDGTLVAGDTLKYSASIANDGDRDVSGAVFTVPLPEGTEYAGLGKRSDSGITYDSDLNQIEWTGDVPAGETVKLAFGVRVTSGGSIAFSDAEIAFDSDGDGVNDTLRKADNDAGMTALFAEYCRPGDIDADGKITLRDAVLVLQTLSGSDAEVCTDADVNDGQIGIAEAVFILNELAE